jgi:hypothetical protein
MCCGKIIQDKLGKVGQIAVGITKASLSNPLKPGLFKDSKFVSHMLHIDLKQRQTRIEVCRACEKSTWMTKADYAAWLLTHGVAVIKKIDDLASLPELAINKEQTDGKTLFCAICKCWIPAKAGNNNETCPLNKWSD